MATLPALPQRTHLSRPSTGNLARGTVHPRPKRFVKAVADDAADDRANHASPFFLEICGGAAWGGSSAIALRWGSKQDAHCVRPGSKGSRAPNTESRGFDRSNWLLGLHR